MIWMGMIITDDPKPAIARVAIRSLVLFGCDQVTGLARVLSLILSRICFDQDVRFVLVTAKKKTAALVRVGLLAVCSDLLQMLLFEFNCHLVLISHSEAHFICRLHRDHVRARIEPVQQRVVMCNDLSRGQKLVVHGRVSVADQAHIIT